MTEYVLLAASSVVSVVVNALGRFRPRRPERVLVIKLDHIGDLVAATPVFRALAEARPGIPIDALVGPWTSELLTGHPRLARVLVYDAPRFRRGPGTDPRHPAAALREVARGGYTTVVELRGDAWTLLLPFLCGARVRRDRGTVRLRSWLARRLFGGRAVPGPLHEVETNLAVIRPLMAGTPRVEPRVELWVSDDERRGVREKLRPLGLDPARAFACLHPGASWAPRRWRPERFAWIADRLRDHYDIQVVVVGSAGEREVEEGIRRSVRGAPPVFAFGLLSLREIAALIASSALVIGNDSGLVHVAAAFDVPVIALFGAQDPERARPWSPDAVVLHHRVPCCPCRQVVCVMPEEPCVNRIQTEEVAAAADRLLRGRGLVR